MTILQPGMSDSTTNHEKWHSIFKRCATLHSPRQMAMHRVSECNVSRQHMKTFTSWSYPLRAKSLPKPPPTTHNLPFHTAIEHPNRGRGPMPCVVGMPTSHVSTFTTAGHRTTRDRMHIKGHNFVQHTQDVPTS